MNVAMSRRTFLLAIVVVSGCAATRTPPSNHMTAAPPVAGILYTETQQLSGPVVTNVNDCRLIVGGWHFRVDEGTVRLFWTPNGRVLGIQPPPQPSETATGSWEDGTLSLHGERETPGPDPRRPAKDPVTYELKRDGSHLVGSRNGVPIRLAPTELHYPDCSKELVP